MSGSAALSAKATAAPTERGPSPVRRARLSGPSIRLDSRINAIRRDIADIELSDRLFASRYAVPERAGVAAAATMLRDAPRADATAVSQLLHGEAFAVLDITDGWAWGYALHDHYVGYLDAGALGLPVESSHIVHAVQAPVFAGPDIKAPATAFWPMGARFAATREGAFLKTAGGYVHARHARAIATPETDPVAIAERLLGMPYLWGGRGAGGIDCSGLVQLALGMTGIAAPRDSDQQQALGRVLAADAPLRRGDLLFFPGHVGLMVDAENMIHANAHWMAVMIEPLAAVIARLAATQPDPVVARRRLEA